MRWPGANLEEKHEPRGVSVAEAQNGDSMKSSGRNLTLAAIEKQSFCVCGRMSELGQGRRSRAVVRGSALPQKADQPLLQSIISSVPTTDFPLGKTARTDPIALV